MSMSYVHHTAPRDFSKDEIIKIATATSSSSSDGGSSSSSSSSSGGGGATDLFLNLEVWCQDMLGTEAVKRLLIKCVNQALNEFWFETSVLNHPSLSGPNIGNSDLSKVDEAFLDLYTLDSPLLYQIKLHSRASGWNGKSEENGKVTEYMMPACDQSMFVRVLAKMLSKLQPGAETKTWCIEAGMQPVPLVSHDDDILLDDSMCKHVPNDISWINHHYSSSKLNPASKLNPTSKLSPTSKLNPTSELYGSDIIMKAASRLIEQREVRYRILCRSDRNHASTLDGSQLISDSACSLQYNRRSVAYVSMGGQEDDGGCVVRLYNWKPLQVRSLVTNELLPFLTWTQQRNDLLNNVLHQKLGLFSHCAGNIHNSRQLSTIGKLVRCPLSTPGNSITTMQEGSYRSSNPITPPVLRQQKGAESINRGVFNRFKKKQHGFSKAAVVAFPSTSSRSTNVSNHGGNVSVSGGVGNVSTVPVPLGGVRESSSSTRDRRAKLINKTAGQHNFQLPFSRLIAGAVPPKCKNTFGINNDNSIRGSSSRGSSRDMLMFASDPVQRHCIPFAQLGHKQNMRYAHTSRITSIRSKVEASSVTSISNAKRTTNRVKSGDLKLFLSSCRLLHTWRVPMKLINSSGTSSTTTTTTRNTTTTTRNTTSGSGRIVNDHFLLSAVSYLQREIAAEPVLLSVMSSSGSDNNILGRFDVIERLRIDNHHRRGGEEVHAITSRSNSSIRSSSDGRGSKSVYLQCIVEGMLVLCVVSAGNKDELCGLDMYVTNVNSLMGELDAVATPMEGKQSFRRLRHIASTLFKLVQRIQFNAFMFNFQLKIIFDGLYEDLSGVTTTTTTTGSILSSLSSTSLPQSIFPTLTDVMQQFTGILNNNSISSIISLRFRVMSVARALEMHPQHCVDTFTRLFATPGKYSLLSSHLLRSDACESLVAISTNNSFYPLFTPGTTSSGSTTSSSTMGSSSKTAHHSSPRTNSSGCKHYMIISKPHAMDAKGTFDVTYAVILPKITNPQKRNAFSRYGHYLTATEDKTALVRKHGTYMLFTLLRRASIELQLDCIWSKVRGWNMTHYYDFTSHHDVTGPNDITELEIRALCMSCSQYKLELLDPRLAILKDLQIDWISLTGALETVFPKRARVVSVIDGKVFVFFYSAREAERMFVLLMYEPSYAMSSDSLLCCRDMLMCTRSEKEDGSDVEDQDTLMHEFTQFVLSWVFYTSKDLK